MVVLGLLWGHRFLAVDKAILWEGFGLDIHKCHQKMVLAINSNTNENVALKLAFWVVSGL